MAIIIDETKVKVNTTMKLYHRYRMFCVIWCATETFFFGGIIYGWGSLVFVLKEEGFYSDLCKAPMPKVEKEVFQNISLIDGYYHEENKTSTQHHSEDTNNGCQEQEAKLGLWFSIAVAFMYVCLAFLGYLTTNLGTQITRHIFT